MTFGVKLKEFRQTAGLTQDGLAVASGVPVGTIRDYEQGKRDPLLSTAQKLATALGKPLEAFTSAELPDEASRPTKGKGRKPAEAPEPAPAKKNPRKRKGE